MKRLLFFLFLLVAGNLVAQPYKQNSFTTNAIGRTPSTLPANTSALYPVMVLNPDGSGTDRVIHFSPYFIMTGTNAGFGGNLSGYFGTFSNGVIMPFGTANTLLSLSAAKFATSIPNAAGVLTNDGAGGLGYSTAYVGTNGTGFPALTGDITTVQGAVATTLKNTGTAGTYAGITFDAKGRETSAVPVPVAIFTGGYVNINGIARVHGLNWGTTISWTAAAETGVATPLKRSGTFSNLVYRSATPTTLAPFGTGTNMSLILSTNGVQSSFFVTLTGDGVTTTTNSGTLSLTIPANTSCAWRITNNVSAVADHSFSCEFY